MPVKWGVACAVLLVSATAWGQEDDAACQASYVEGQKLYKLEHDLLGGRKQLLVCAKTCPDQLRASCGTWLKEIESELPTVVVKAKDGHGNDIPDVTVDVDDTPVPNYVEGLPIELNPGKHTLRVSGKSGKSVQQAIVVNAGEKLKVAEVWLEPRIVEATRVRRPVPVGAFVLLSVGAAALVSFGTFAIWSTVEFNQTNGCAPSCDPSTHDGGFDAKTAIADVSLGVAGAALLAAVIVVLTRPRVVEHVRQGWLVGPASLTCRF